MDDQDLIDLQKKVFNHQLTKQHITALKQVVVNEDYDEAKAMKGIDFEAFKTFMMKYIQKMKGHTCWELLRFYGFDSDLKLKRQLLDDTSIPEETIKSARSFELTTEAIKFLKKIFDMYKIQNNQSRESYLDQPGIEKVFSTCPPSDGLPFDAKREA